MKMIVYTNIARMIMKEKQMTKIAVIVMHVKRIYHTEIILRCRTENERTQIVIWMEAHS